MRNRSVLHGRGHPVIRALVALLALIGLLAEAEAGGFHRGGVTRAPIVSSVSPPGGSNLGGDLVTVNGFHFLTTTRVQFGSNLYVAPSFTVVNDNVITVTTPAHPLGVVNVFVFSTVGASGAAPKNQFVFSLPAAPTVTAIAPANGPEAGGTTVTITGANLSTVTGVNFGATPGTSVSCTTTCSATSPAGTGTVDITAIGPGGTSQTSAADLFTYNAPVPAVVGSLSPNNGGTTGGTPFTINGSAFTGVTSVQVGATVLSPCGTAPCFTFVNDSTIAATSPAGSSSEHVTVTVPAGTSASTAADLFTFADWRLSWAACSQAPCATDDFGVFLGGTELRSLTTHTTLAGNIIPGTNGLGVCSTASINYNPGRGGCESVLAVNGFWKDIACSPPNAPTGQGPQIFVLNNPAAHWNQEVELDGTCNGAFDVSDAFTNLTFSLDGAGAAISPPISLLVGSGFGKTMHARNDVTGTWPTFVLPSAANTIRALDEYLDSTTTNCGGGPCDYLLMGTANGMYHATWKASPWNFTPNNTAEPWGVGACHSANNCTNQLADWAGQTLPPSTGPFAGRETATVTPATPSHITLHIAGQWASPPIGTVTVTNFAVGTGGSGAGCGNVTNAPIISSAAATANTTTLTYVAATSGPGCSTGGHIVCGTGGCGGMTIDVSGIYQTGGPAGSSTDCAGVHLFVACGNNNRTTSLATCAGAEYSATLMEVWKRVDGNSPHWTLFWVVPPPYSSITSNSGLRGMACIPYGAGYALLATTEGGGGCVWRIDPAGIAPAVCELSLIGASWSRGYGINAYNNMIFVNNSVVFGEGDSAGQPPGHPKGLNGWDGGSGFWVRPLANNPAYSLYPTDNNNGTGDYAALLGVMAKRVPQPPAGTTNWGALCTGSPLLCPSMVSTRSIVLSWLPQDNGQVLYGGTFDANNTLVHDTAQIYAVPLSTIGGIP